MNICKLMNLRRKAASWAACGLLAVCVVSAQTSGGGTTSGNTADVTALNNLLAMQNLQSAFFTQGLQKFQASDFAGINLSCSTNTPTYDLLKAINTQMGQQITSLQGAITNLGGTPVQPCTYTFTFTTPQAFLNQAVTFANLSSSSFATNTAGINSSDVRTNLATITAVQARQSAFLDVLNAANPFPQAFEPTVTQSDVTNRLNPFISSCAGTTPGGGSNSITAVAGPKTTTVTVSKQLTLDATGSTGPSGSTLTYNWGMAPNSPRTASIINANTATPTVQFNEGYGIYTFQLTVTGANGSSAQDTISILYVGR